MCTSAITADLRLFLLILLLFQTFLAKTQIYLICSAHISNQCKSSAGYVLMIFVHILTKYVCHTWLWLQDCCNLQENLKQTGRVASQKHATQTPRV